MKNLLTSLVILWSFGRVLACPEACSCTLLTKGTKAFCYGDRLGYFPTNFPNDTYYIELAYNDIKTVNVKICSLYPELETLHLWYNQITYLQDDAFADCRNLKTLLLHSNALSTINSFMFRNLTNLVELDLSYNLITTIHPDTFLEVPNLERLYLNNNRLGNNIFYLISSLTLLTYLDLSQNSISSLPENSFVNLNNLYSLSLHHNNLSSIPKHVLVNKTNLYYLYLYDNIITDIRVDTFVNLNNLRYLGLQNNMLTTVDPIIFQNMDNLYELNLRNNNIREIKSGMPRITNLNQMYLSGNPLVCDCGILSFYEWAIETPSIAADARCTNGKNLIYMTPKEFRQCSLDCECFNGGSCITKEDNSTACDCVGNWSGEKCQVSQCASYDCGDDVCYTEAQNGTAYCKNSLCKGNDLKSQLSFKFN